MELGQRHRCPLAYLPSASPVQLESSAFPGRAASCCAADSRVERRRRKRRDLDWKAYPAENSRSSSPSLHSPIPISICHPAEDTPVDLAGTQGHCNNRSPCDAVLLLTFVPSLLIHDPVQEPPGSVALLCSGGCSHQVEAPSHIFLQSIWQPPSISNSRTARLKRHELLCVAWCDTSSAMRW